MSELREAVSHWHVKSVDEVWSMIQSTTSGLDDAEAARRLTVHGPNEIQAATGVSPWSLLASQFQNILIVILLCAAVISGFLGHEIEAVAIGVIVLFAVLLGFVQEFRAERAMHALRQMAAPMATVIRGNRELSISAREVVPGDVILIRTGDKIPADIRLFESVNLRIEEAALTGESEAVEKQTQRLNGNDSALGDRTNMAYAGTVATYGRGRGVAVATGMKTEFGAIAQLLKTVSKSRTPLQQSLDRVGQALAKVAGAIVIAIVATGLWRGQPLIEMLIFGIALAVAVVPEALPAVVTISLAIGVQRMVKRNALMRRLPAVETLGSTSVICSDKTGTLTKDEMTIRKLYISDRFIEVSGVGYEPVGEFSHEGSRVSPSGVLVSLLEAGALASDCHLSRESLENRWQIQGDPTEGALVVAAAKAGLNKHELDARSPRVDEIPFTSETKRMTTLHESTEGLIAYSKGAPEVILSSCLWRATDTGELRLDDDLRGQIVEAARQMASSAMRVLGISTKRNANRDTAESEMTFLGLVGMIDPPRPEAAAAIRICEQAGIKPVMITGDHPLTAQAVGRELGVLNSGRVITGNELDQLDEHAFDSIVNEIEVYARVSPAHKLRVVGAWQKQGHIVAMTGDGVNDAPALKKADIGIAMGITGTDVTREAAAMTLTDDNFASIVAAVEEGRAIFENIKKYLMYLLSSNIGEIGLMTGATLFGLPLPLTAVQILYVNLATDGLPALALAVDPPATDLMKHPPRDARRGIFTRPVVMLMLIGGIWSAIINLSMFAWMLHAGHGVDIARAMTFVTLVLTEFTKAYCFRSDRHSVLLPSATNKWLNLAIAWEVLLLFTVVYVPVFQRPLATFALAGFDWLIVTICALSVIPVLETAKWLVRKGAFGQID